ncbi:peptide-methionine (S)-S-oxide reductase activity [Mayamaea pseudoterrestris]|nr:peptide-methionine (S)-S-oxide reductase activity [Mayamaea pseudoterrestris]
MLRRLSQEILRSTTNKSLIASTATKSIAAYGLPSHRMHSTTTDSSSMIPLSRTLALGAGCYWGTEKYVVKDFQKMFPGSIASAAVGFMSPETNAMKNPSYRQVCSGSTGHVEVLNVELNEPEKHFEELIKFFYMFHDPTTKDRQGNDMGSQYGSAIFCSDVQQKEIAGKVKTELQSLLDAGKVKYSGKKIETGIYDIQTFYPAHDEHQAYLEKNPSGYCNHFMRFKEWLVMN